jgi:hypothetical protein
MGEVLLERLALGLPERSVQPHLDGDLERFAACHPHLASDPFVPGAADTFTGGPEKGKAASPTPGGGRTRKRVHEL